MQVIFALEESFESCFKSQLDFSINSINSKIYYDPPNTEHYINPEVYFDIDLSKYYENEELVIEELSIDLDYTNDLQFTDAEVFEKYALIEERIIFTLLNNQSLSRFPFK